MRHDSGSYPLIETVDLSKQTEPVHNAITTSKNTDKTVVLSFSLSGQMLAELASAPIPLDLVFFASGLDGDSISPRLVAATNSSNVSETLNPYGRQLGSHSQFRNEYYDWLVSGEHDPLPKLCQRPYPTRIVIIHGKDDRKAPIRIDKIQSQIAQCERNGIPVQFILLKSNLHSPALIQSIDLSKGLISEILGTSISRPTTNNHAGTIEND